MRVWRVGSISMGAALVFLGIMLLLTQILEWNTAYVMTSWWPFILIILGGEILFYLIFANQENPKVKYDLVSILFAALIGAAGISLSFFQASGVMGAVQSWVSAEEKTMEIPSFTQTLTDEIKRVVVDTGPHDLTIEGGTGDEVSVFGTYRSTTHNGEGKLNSPGDYLQYEVKGDSLYISLMGLPSESGPFERYSQMDATLVVPTKAGLEVSGDGNSITLKPRHLLSHWSVRESSAVNILLSEGSDINLLAENVADIKDNENWKMEEHTHSEEKEFQDEVIYEDGAENGNYKVGSGTYELLVSDSHSLAVRQGK
ncbi:MAG: LiaF transmembrane domain-containing protein [Bacillota bacterium]